MSLQEWMAKADIWIEELFARESGGHDAWHTRRVLKNAQKLMRREGGNETVICLAAMLHDADDRKLFASKNNENARRFMAENGVDAATAESVCHVIEQVAFKGSDSVVPDTLEGRIVQDADRLDALGAIGIARAFAYGGSHGRAMHDPAQPPHLGMNDQEYTANQGTTVNHFYEKLFLLTDMMNTRSAWEMAVARSDYMRAFLQEFQAEWQGNDLQWGDGSNG